MSTGGAPIKAIMKQVVAVRGRAIVLLLLLERVEVKKELEAVPFFSGSRLGRKNYDERWSRGLSAR